MWQERLVELLWDVWQNVLCCGILVFIFAAAAVVIGGVAAGEKKEEEEPREPRREPPLVRGEQGELKLVWRDKGPKSHTLPTQGRITIGRSLDCDIVLQGPAVSKRHVRMEVVGPEVILVDLDSTNGTFVGSQRIGRTQVYPGDVIHIGGYTLGLVTVRDTDCRVIRPN